MVGIERGSNKSAYLLGQKRTTFEQKSKLPPLQSLQKVKKVFTFSDGRKVEAEHTIISENTIEISTIVHPMNPRNQIALDKDAVRDILEQIRNRGVDKEGVALREGEKYLIIEGSRRRYCCIETHQDFPLWVIHGKLTAKEIYEIINASQSSKKFSYRELGTQYLKQMQEFNFVTNESFAGYLNTSTETVRKRIQAAKIDNNLINIFPDAEGIPNSFYSRLAKIEKILKKQSIDLESILNKIKKEIQFDKSIDVNNQQNQLMHQLDATIKNVLGDQKDQMWDTYDLEIFDNKDKYAKISRNSNGRKVKFEFNRLNSNLIQEIESLIIECLKKHK